MVKENLSFSQLRVVRTLFPPKQQGMKSCRAALCIYTPQKLLQLRGDFGKGISGTKAFLIIATGSTCEAQDETGKRCGKKAKFTVDFDVLGNEEHVPVCSHEHGRLVRQTIASQLGKNEHDPTFGLNGWGRA